MKKKILAAFLMAAAVTLAACGGKTEKDEKAESAGTENKKEQAADDSTGEDTGYLKDLNAADYVTLGDYMGLQVSLAEPEVTNEYLDAYIDYILENNAETKKVEGRTVQTGDIVNIDYVGKLDGVAFDGGTAAGYDLTIGSGQFISGFEDGCIGMEIGETRDVEATFPDPYTNPDLAGKTAVFTVTVNSISVKEKPELTDEYVRSLELKECINVEEYRDYTRKVLLDQQKEKYESEKADLAYEALREKCQIGELPASLTDRINSTLITNLTSYANASGMDLATCVSFIYGGKAEDYEQTIENQTNYLAEYYLIMQAIADKENITVSEEELNKALEEGAANYGYATAEEYKEVIDLEAFRESQMTKKVSEFVADNATVTAAE